MSDSPPSDVAAERAVLAGIFAHGGDVYHDIADIVTSQTFSVPSNAAIWACMEHCLKDAPNGRLDYPTLLSSANSLGLKSLFEKESDQAHLRGIMNMATNLAVVPQNVRKMAARVRRLEVGRLLHSQLVMATNNISGLTGDESVDQILALAEGPVFDFSNLLTRGVSTGPVRIGRNAVAYVQHLMDNPREMMGISTGFAQFDRAIGGGIRPNSLDVIAARSKAGKSFVLDNVAVYIAKTLGIPILNIDTEMSEEEHVARICANLSGVATHEIETGKCVLNDKHKTAVLQGAKILTDIPYDYLNVIGMPFEEILASMRRWVTKTVGLDANGKAKPCVILYDYIKMMSADFLSADLKEYQALGFITTALKNFMGRFGVGSLCFVQLNREGIEKEDESAISGSDRIVHYCTSVTIFKKKSDTEKSEDPTYSHKFVPVVARHGQGLADDDYINLLADYSVGRIVEGPTRDQLAKAKTHGNVQRQGFVSTGDPKTKEQLQL